MLRNLYARRNSKSQSAITILNPNRSFIELDSPFTLLSPMTRSHRATQTSADMSVGQFNIIQLPQASIIQLF